MNRDCPNFSLRILFRSNQSMYCNTLNARSIIQKIIEISMFLWRNVLMKKIIIAILFLIFIITATQSYSQRYSITKADIEDVYLEEIFDKDLQISDIKDLNEINTIFLANNDLLVQEGKTITTYYDLNKSKDLRKEPVILSENAFIGESHEDYQPKYIYDQDLVFFLETDKDNPEKKHLYFIKSDGVKKRRLMKDVKSNEFALHKVYGRNEALIWIENDIYLFTFSLERVLFKRIFTRVMSHLFIPRQNKLYTIIAKSDDELDTKLNPNNLIRSKGDLYVSEYDGRRKRLITDNVNFVEYYRNVNKLFFVKNGSFYSGDLYSIDLAENKREMLKVVEDVEFRTYREKDKFVNPLLKNEAKNTPAYKYFQKEDLLLAIIRDKSTEDAETALEENEIEMADGEPDIGVDVNLDEDEIKIISEKSDLTSPNENEAEGEDTVLEEALEDFTPFEFKNQYNKKLYLIDLKINEKELIASDIIDFEANSFTKDVILFKANAEGQKGKIDLYVYNLEEGTGDLPEGIENGETDQMNEETGEKLLVREVFQGNKNIRYYPYYDLLYYTKKHEIKPALSEKDKEIVKEYYDEVPEDVEITVVDESAEAEEVEETVQEYPETDDLDFFVMDVFRRENMFKSENLKTIFSNKYDYYPWVLKMKAAYEKSNGLIQTDFIDAATAKSISFDSLYFDASYDFEYIGTVQRKYGRIKLIVNRVWVDETLIEQIKARELEQRKQNRELAKNLLDEGIKLYNEEKYEEAQDKFYKALENNDRDYLAHYWLGKTQRKLDDTVGAKYSFLTSIRLKDNYPFSHYELGDINYEEENDKEALNSFKNAEALKPNWAMLYYKMGVSNLALDNYDKAVDYFEKALAVQPDGLSQEYTGYANYNISLAYKRKGLANDNINPADLDNAIKYADIAISINPSYVRPHIVKAEIYYERENYEQALASIDKGLVLDAENKYLSFISGKSHHEMIKRNVGDFDENYNTAESSYNKVLNIDEDFDAAQYNLVLLYSINKQLNEALNRAEALKENENDFKAIELYAKILQAISKESGQDTTESEQLFEKAKTLNKKSPLSYVGLGDIAYSNNNFVRALDYYNQALENSPNNSSVLHKIANTKAKTENYEEAITTYNQALENASAIEKAEIYKNLAKTYYKMDDKASAEANFRNAAEIKEDDEVYHFLGLIEAQKGNYAQSLENFNKITENYKKFADVQELVSLIKTVE